jgi:tetratricopeptide (TPR) repeat protein
MDPFSVYNPIRSAIVVGAAGERESHMLGGIRPALTPVVVLLLAGVARGQVLPDSGAAVEPPARHVPVKEVSHRQLDHLEAVKLYGVATILERKNHLIQAVRTLEAAVRLDPDSPVPLRALVPILFALDRADEAFDGCRRVLELDPEDLDTAFLLGRQLRNRDRKEEARAVFAKAASRPALDTRLDLKARLCFELAALCEDAKDWAEAEKNFRRVTEVLDRPDALRELGALNRDEIDAQAADTWERLGRVCVEAKAFDRAVAAFQQSVRHDPIRSPRLSLNLAEVLAKASRPADALVRLEEYLGMHPAGAEGYELRIKLQRELGRADDIVPALEQSSAQDPHNTELSLLLAREYRAADRDDDARGVYQRVLKVRPEVEAYRGLFALYAKRADGPQQILNLLNSAAKPPEGDKEGAGDPEQAAHLRAIAAALRGDAAVVKKLLEASKARLDPRARAGDRLFGGTRSLLATLAVRTRQLEVAEALYRSFLTPDGRVIRVDVRFDPSGAEHEIYGGLLQVLRRAHKYDAVIELCRKGLRVTEATNRVVFHLYLAEALMIRGDVKEALESAYAAVNDSGADDRLSCRLDRAGFLSEAGKHMEAVAECRDLLKEHNKRSEIRLIRLKYSSVLSAAKDPAGAVQQLRMLLEDDSSDAELCNDLGYLLADQNKELPEAERLIRKALALDRDQRRDVKEGVDEGENPAYLDSLGWVLLRRGQYEQAVRELERASSLPDGAEDPVVWDHLGDAYQRLGKRAQAFAAWRKAIAQYELGVRRKTDGRYDDIKEKLRHHE